MGGQASSSVRYQWRSDVADEELVALTLAHGGRAERGWWDRIRPHSLGWVNARAADGRLVGFVHVAWDGGDHAFLLDTKVDPRYQREGIGMELVRAAVDHARWAGCEWMHVDYDQSLGSFYEACGFRSSAAGLLHLNPRG